MLEFVFAETRILKEIVEAVRELVSEVTLGFTSDGIKMQSMDAANVSLCCLTLKASGFEMYRCDKAVSLGVNLNVLALALKGASNQSRLSIYVDEHDDPDDITSLSFKFESEGEPTLFKLGLLNIQSELHTIPDQEYALELELPAAKFRRLCINLMRWDDCVFMSTDYKGNLNLFSKGPQGQMETCLRFDSDDIDITKNKDVSAEFSLSKLVVFSKAAPLCTRMKLRVENELPLVALYPIAGIGSIAFYLAPKMNTD